LLLLLRKSAAAGRKAYFLYADYKKGILWCIFVSILRTVAFADALLRNSNS
jgi:hypothetical protein